MGMHFKDVKYFEEITDFLGYKDFSGLRLLELGDLFIRRDLHDIMKHRLSSQYFEAKGFEVTVIDLGVGTEANATKNIWEVDLSKPVPVVSDSMYDCTWDFVVDFGTAEHIENQYWLNWNIHNFCKKDGVMIRSNPSDRYCDGYPEKHHGLYHYTPAFYIKLAQLCKYKIVDIREMPQKYWPSYIPNRKNFLYTTLLNTTYNAFPSEEEFKEIAVELGDYR